MADPIMASFLHGRCTLSARFGADRSRLGSISIRVVFEIVEAERDFLATMITFVNIFGLSSFPPENLLGDVGKTMLSRLWRIG